MADVGTAGRSGWPIRSTWARGMTAVRGGARVSGGRGDALLVIDRHEHARRHAAGIGAVTDTWLLHRLLTLPSDELVRWVDLSDADVHRLRRAHPAVVETSAAGVRRRLRSPVDVRLVVVRGRRWRTGLQTASAFEAFAQCVLWLPTPPREIANVLWEAQLIGIGVWAGSSDEPAQLLAPAPWRRRYVKGATWRFAERAYAAWLNATHPQESCVAASDRPAQPVAGATDQPPLPFAPDVGSRGV